MAYMRIHCEYCGGTWEIYHRDDFNADKARQCPHCFSKIDAQTWANQVLPAFGLVHDANAELYKDHKGHCTPLFSFDVIADHLFVNRFEEQDDDESDDLNDFTLQVDDLELDDICNFELDSPELSNEELLELFRKNPN